KALLTQSRFLADRSNQHVRSGDCATALLLAVEGLPDGSRDVDRPYAPEAEWALANAWQQLKELRVLSGHEGAVLSAAFSPDGQRVLAGCGDGDGRLGEVASGKMIAVWRGRERWLGNPSDFGPDRSAAFSPDGQRVLTVSEVCTARLWDATSGEEI